MTIYSKKKRSNLWMDSFYVNSHCRPAVRRTHKFCEEDTSRRALDRIDSFDSADVALHESLLLLYFLSADGCTEAFTPHKTFLLRPFSTPQTGGQKWTEVDKYFKCHGWLSCHIYSLLSSSLFYVSCLSQVVNVTQMTRGKPTASRLRFLIASQWHWKFKFPQFCVHHVK